MTNGPRIRFKGPKSQAERLAGEWPCLHKPLRLAILDLADIMWQKHRLALVITCLYRTKSENAKLKGAHPKSLHMSNRAADIRSRNLSLSDGAALREYFTLAHPFDGIDFVIERDHFHVEAEKT